MREIGSILVQRVFISFILIIFIIVSYLLLGFMIDEGIVRDTSSPMYLGLTFLNIIFYLPCTVGFMIDEGIVGAR